MSEHFTVGISSSLSGILMAGEPENDFDRYDQSLVNYTVANYDFEDDALDGDFGTRLVDVPLPVFLSRIDHLFGTVLGYKVIG